MKKMFLLIGLILLLFLSGCGDDFDTAHFMWEDAIYIATEEPVVISLLGEELGEIVSEVDRKAEQNGEARDLAVGTKLFSITEREFRGDSVGYIAYESVDRFYVASKWMDGRE